ncbi:MFS transporter [Desulfobulbus elongatus]|uniref:MFS transporter n=1 Tax=Desulfobulbus elongatus TaxID=53332 RepID=UPI0006852E02
MNSPRIQSGSIAFRKVNLALFAAGFVTFITLYDVQPLLPEFAREFGIRPAWASLPLSAASFTLAMAMLLAGTLSETLGRKPVMMCSLFLTSILALLTAFSHSFSSLVLLRFVQGIVLAGLPPVAMAYLSEEIEPATVGTAMGLYISGNAIGGMSGRLFTATVTDYFSWHIALGLVGVISLMLSIYFACSLPPSTHFRNRPFENRYLLTSVLQQLRDPSLLCLYGISFMVMGSFVTVFNYITFRLLGEEYGLSQTMVSLIFLTYLLGAYSSSSVSKLVNRFGRFFAIRACVVVMFAGIAITLARPLPLVIAGIAVFTCGFFGAHTIASTWVGRHARTAKAQAAALYLFFYYLGASISGTVGGFCWAGVGWQGVVGFISLLLVTALCLTLVLARLFIEPKEAALPVRNQARGGNG